MSWKSERTVEIRFRKAQRQIQTEKCLTSGKLNFKSLLEAIHSEAQVGKFIWNQFEIEMRVRQIFLPLQLHYTSKIFLDEKRKLFFAS